MNTAGVESKIAFVHISIIEEICLITSNHDIYISKSRENLQSFSFFKLTLLEGCDKIIKLESGSTFLSFLTETQRFFTNYKDNEGLGDYPEFHEIERFNDFHITTFKCGLDYILLRGIPKLDPFGMNENRVQRPLLDKTFTEEAWEHHERQTGDGFSQASTDSPQDNLTHVSPKPFKHIASLHKGGNKIKFIENGVEMINQSDEEGNFVTAIVSENKMQNYLGELVQFYPEDMFNVNDKEITKRMIMAESQSYNKTTPQPHSQPKVRIKTPMPTRAAFMDSSGTTTDESDHSVDEDLNRKQVKIDHPIIKYLKKARDRWLEFENNCKESDVVPNGKFYFSTFKFIGHVKSTNIISFSLIDKDISVSQRQHLDTASKTDRQRANELAISKHLPNSFICSIQ